MNCKNCEYSSFGSRDSLSDICDGCTSDPNTGWGGFYDHSIDRSFNNEQEQLDYYSSDYYDEDYE